MIKTFALILILFLSKSFLYGQLIINHQNVNITELSDDEITNAKSVLHIAYGHTSHGSQLTEGMRGLITFANNGGKGLSLSNNIFDWNNGGTNGALDLHDYAMAGDVGYFPNWYNNTINYLNDASNSDVNVVMWSWCGQVDNKYASGTLYSEYLEPMALLESSYPDVKFIYMTGHLEHANHANIKAANDSIRRYCLREGKILYDFADIESHDPDGNFFEYANDDCSYYLTESSNTPIGNWATEWRASHTENTDWYDCGSAHSDALNANMKAYAAWAMFVAISIDFTTGISDIPKGKISVYPNPCADYINFDIKSSSISHIIMNDISGKIVLKIDYKGEENISVSHLIPGMYLLTIEKNNGEKLISKFIKK